MKKVGSLQPLLNFSKKYSPLPLPISFQKRCPSPFGPMSKRKLSLFRMASLNRVLLRTRYSMNKRKSDGLGFIIPFTKGRDDLVMYCSQSLAHYGGRFWKEKKRGMGGYLKKIKNGGRDLIFFMVGTLTQHAWHAKSQSAATFC